MEDFSFDPRSWARRPGATRPDAPGTSPPAPLPAPAPAEAAEPTSAAPDAAAPASESLPEMWRAVSTGFRPGTPPAAPDTDAPEPSRPLALPLPLLMAAASLALLAGGGSWAWLTRHAPGALSPQASAAATPAAATSPEPAPKPPPPPEGAVERSFNLTAAKELEPALAAVGVAPGEAQVAARAASSALARPGNIRARIVLVPAGDGVLLEQVHASYNDGSGVMVTRDAGGRFSARIIAAELKSVIKVLRGELDSESFYTSAVSAGVTDTLIPEFINAFSFDFNLAAEVLPGDTFEVGFEQQVNAEGEPVGQPHLLFASLTTRTKSLALYRFVNDAGEVGWFDGNGASTRRGLMRTPVDGARISSKFGPRFHPVLRYTRLHGGTDFAAPVGTPIYAAAGGTITSASPSRCAGNMVVMSHDNGWQTRYFHLSRYADGLTPGQRVEQGYTIGYVGNTGTCTTGPHLHYEVHINGEKVDPLSIKTDDAKRKRMEGDSLAAFRKGRDRVDSARALQGS